MPYCVARRQILPAGILRQANEAEADINLWGTFTELPVGFLEVLGNSFRQEPGGIDDQGKGWGGKGKEPHALPQVKAATRTAGLLWLELLLAMGAEDIFTGKDLGRIFFRGGIRVAARHRDGERV